MRTKTSKLLAIGILAGACLLAEASGAAAPPGGGDAPPPPKLKQYETLTTKLSVLVKGNAKEAALLEIASPAETFTIPIEGGAGAFELSVPLAPNRINRVYFTSIGAGGLRSPAEVVRILHDVEPPEVDVDVDMALVLSESSETIDVSGRVSDRLSGGYGMRVLVNGVQALVHEGFGTNGTFLALDVPLDQPPGPTPSFGTSPALDELQITAIDRLGNRIQETVSLAANPTMLPILIRPPMPVIGELEVVSGGNQAAEVMQEVANPLVVRVVKPDGSGLANKLVTFEVVKSDGIVAATAGGAGKRELQLFTDFNGEARGYWTLGSDAGFGNNLVRVVSKDILGPVFFGASASPGAPDQINVSEGNNQRVQLGGTAPDPLRAWVSDACNGVAGIPVTFTVVNGDGLVDGQSQATVLTGLAGYASVPFSMVSTPGGNYVEADFPGNTGLPATFVLYGVATDPLQTTDLKGIVLDNSSLPVGSATCVLTVGTTTLPPMVTDSEGEFEFIDIGLGGPAHLFVDGATATELGGVSIPPGTFPPLAYELTIIPNAVNAIGMPVLLPPLDPANNVVYDGTKNVSLTIAELPGMSMFLPAGTVVHHPDGTLVDVDHPITLSMNQVHIDDIPMPMTDGAAPPFAGTVQPGGARFDPPMQITYPNLSGLHPGTVTNFLSFDHDLHQFVIVSPGYVSDDGSVIKSAAGDGIDKAGWWCNCPPYAVTADCELCSETCVDNGALSYTGSSTVTVSHEVVCISDPKAVTFTAPDATDSGGGKEESCPDGSGSSVPIDPVAPSYAWVIKRDGTEVAAGTGKTASITPTDKGVYEATFTISAARDCPPAELKPSAKATAVELTLAKEGNTLIESGNNYSENTTLKLTVMPDPGVALKARFKEKAGTTYYDGVSGATDLTKASVNTVPLSSGAAQLVIKSVSNASTVAGPASALLHVELLDAMDSIICTSTDLSVDQWVDEDSNGFFDWLDQSTNAILSCAKGKAGEVGAVTGEVTAMSQGTDACGTTALGSTAIKISPVCTSASPNPHRLNAGQELTITVLHESRHAWLNHELARNDVGADDDANPATPSNDDDGDRWAEVLSFSSADDIAEMSSPSTDDGTPDPPGTFTVQETDAEDFGQTHKAVCP